MRSLHLTGEPIPGFFLLRMTETRSNTHSSLQLPGWHKGCAGIVEVNRRFSVQPVSKRRESLRGSALGQDLKYPYSLPNCAVNNQDEHCRVFLPQSETAVLLPRLTLREAGRST